MKKQEPYYTCFDDDTGHELHEELNEAVEEFVDQMHPYPIKDMGTIEVHVFKPKPFTREIVDRHVHDLLESLVIRLDEEFHVADDGNSGLEQDSPVLNAVQVVLTDVVLNNYIPQWWEASGEVMKINAVEWVREHQPEWLKDGEDGK